MFDTIQILIDDKEYEKAEENIEQILSKEDVSEKEYSYANYLKGQFYLNNDNPKKSYYRARQALLESIQSRYPYPLAFCRYAAIEEDKNVAINYLKKGLEYYPKNSDIYFSLLTKLSSFEEKLECINKIRELSIVDYKLLKEVIEIQISNDRWASCSDFVVNIFNTNLDDRDRLIFELVLAYSLLQTDEQDNLKTSEKLLLELVEKDINNSLEYAHFMGLVGLFLKENNHNKLKHFFDKIPLNGLEDLYGRIFIDFKNIYIDIFDALLIYFEKDKERKQKAKVLKSMYLYNRENSIVELDNETQKKDLKILSDYFKKNPDDMIIGKAIINIQLKFKLYIEAYQTFIDLGEQSSTFIQGESDYIDDILDKNIEISEEEAMMNWWILIKIINDVLKSKEDIK